MKNLKNYVKLNYNKIITIVMVSVLIISELSGAVKVIAYEVNRVKNTTNTGEYYNIELQNENTLNKAKLLEENEILIKDATPSINQIEYDLKTEVVEKRTIDSKTFKKSDGTYVKDTYFEPIHKVENGKYVDIDNTLENISRNRSLPVYENKVGNYNFKVDGKEASIENRNKQKIIISNDNANLRNYDVEGNVILYSEAYQNIDLEYRLNNSSFNTTFIINGKINTDEIIYSINHSGLKYIEEENLLLFLDENDQVIYVYQKPVIIDQSGVNTVQEIEFLDNDNILNVKIKLDQKWINSNERVYPLKMNTKVLNEVYEEVSIKSSYNRSAQPTITSEYFDLFVGYEDGYTTVGEFLGTTRTYIQVGNLNLGSDKEIVSADLSLYKKLQIDEQWNKISIGKSNTNENVSNINWQNKPDVTNIGTVDVIEKPGWQKFNVTSYIQDIYNGKKNVLELKATKEGAGYRANIFMSESAIDSGMPKLSVTYRDAYDIDPNLPISTFDTEMRIYSKQNIGFNSFSFDGIAKPDSQVIFDLVEKSRNKVVNTEVSKGNSSKYFIDPIYVSNPMNDVQQYKKSDVNYTTNYIDKSRINNFDTVYEYKVKVKNDNENSNKEYRTDYFVKYKVKLGDNLKSISAYYGVPIQDIKDDNNLKTNNIKENDVLLVRFRKNNPKVSKDIYTPPLKIANYKAIYVNKGPRCVAGFCEILDPISISTGNYYAEQTDFNIEDIHEINFNRYYNSTSPQISNMFGNGFTTIYESYITYDKDGNMLYFVGDGKIYKFDKSQNNFIARDVDRKDVNVINGKVVIKDLFTDTTYYFDEYGYLDRIIDKYHQTSQIIYDEFNMLTEIKIGTKSIKLTYNDRNLVSELTLPNNSKIKYEYDDNRNLIKVIDPLSKATSYTYDSNNFMTKITDKNNNVITNNVYDSEGKILKQIDGNNNVSTITYADHKAIVTNADGKVDEYVYNDNDDITSIIQDGQISSSYTYDKYRNIKTKTDANNEITNYTYDKYNLLKTEYSDGTSEEYTYDSLGNVLTAKDRENKITTNTYNGYDLISNDKDSLKTDFEYDNQGRMIKETNELGNTKSYTYIGNMVKSITHSNGLVQTFEYDSMGNVLKESDNQNKNLTYVYNSNNQMIQKNYYDNTNEKWTYDSNGNIKTYQDRIGGITTNVYDKNNNLISSTKGTLINTKEYNSLNQLISETDAQGLTKTYEYDVYENKISETDVYNNKTLYEYDLNNNIVKTIDSQGNVEENIYENEKLIKTVSKEGLVTEYKYDELNREIEKINPNKTIETKEYDNNLLKKEIDGKGSVTEYFYDQYEREIKTVTTYSDGIVNTTEKKYDALNNVIETTNNGVKTQYEFDVYNQEISVTDDLNNTTKKVYDLDGRIIKEIDALNNVVSKTYDGNGNILSETDKNNSTKTNIYNTNGQLISETDALDYTKTFIYNDKGQVIKVNDPYNVESSFVYDEYNRVIETKLKDKVISKAEYDQYNNEILNETLTEKTKTKYDKYNRVIEKENILGLINYTTYDQYGNIIEEKDNGNQKTTYVYDEYQRKVKTIDSYNREQVDTYNIRDQIIESKSFDNLITKTKYDLNGNAIEVIDGLGNITWNTYNSLNQLIKTKDSQKTIENIYDKNNQIVEVKNLTNNSSTKTVYDKNGNTVKTIDELGYTTITKYDKLNRVVENIDANKNVSKKEYDVYGNVIKEIDALNNIKQHQFDEYGSQVLEIDERGFETRFIYNDDLELINVVDARGYSLKIEYNNKHQKIKEINPNGGITTYEYDLYNKETKVVEPNGKVKINEYDSLGNVIKEVNGNQTTLNIYDNLGRLEQTKLNEVVQVRNVYNNYNQIIESYDANNNKTTNTYNKLGNIISNDDKGHTTTYEYDLNNNIIKQVDNKTYVTENKYDLRNKLVEIKINNKVNKNIEYDGNGNEIKVIEGGLEVKNSYNELNNLSKVETLSDKKNNKYVTIQDITYDQSQNIIKLVDANGNYEEKKYDSNNNVVEEINKNKVVSKYEYDALNNLVKAQNHTGRYVTYTYDLANNMTFKRINDKVATYKYDLENNLVYEENEYGYKTNYKYDNFNRMIEKTNPDKSKVKYTYDNLNNIISENDNKFKYDSRNNKISSINKEGEVTTKYDAFDNKIEVKDTNDKIVKYEYNKNNQLIKQEYAKIVVKYTYNDNNFIETITKDNKLINKYEYNDLNLITKQIQKNTITTKKYDDMARVIEQKTTKKNKTISDIKYKYDGNDNIIEEVVDGKVNTYVYDEYDELKESNKYLEGKLVKTKYEYDLYGNQVMNTNNNDSKVYKYNKNNQVESIKTNKGSIRYKYDGNGNVIKKVNEDNTTDYYTYNDLNQLIRLEQANYTYDYAYDADKERVSQVATDIREYSYDVWYETNSIIIEKSNFSRPKKNIDDDILDTELTQETLDEAFNNLNEEVKTKEVTGGSCQVTSTNVYTDTNSGVYDVTYNKPSVRTDYTVDRNVEYSQVIASNEDVNIYGYDLIESSQKQIVSGLNNSVVATVENDKINKIWYNDYGKQIISLKDLDTMKNNLIVVD